MGVLEEAAAKKLEGFEGLIVERFFTPLRCVQNDSSKVLWDLSSLLVCGILGMTSVDAEASPGC